MLRLQIYAFLATKKNVGRFLLPTPHFLLLKLCYWKVMAYVSFTTPPLMVRLAVPAATRVNVMVTPAAASSGVMVMVPLVVVLVLTVKMSVLLLATVTSVAKSEMCRCSVAVSPLKVCLSVTTVPKNTTGVVGGAGVTAAVVPTACSETVLSVAPVLLMVMVPFCSPAAVGSNVTVMVVAATVPAVGASVVLSMEKSVPVTFKVMSAVRLLPDTVNVAVVVLPTTTEPHSTEVPDTVMVGVDGVPAVAQAVQPSLLLTLKLASNEPQHEAVLNVSPALLPHKYSAKHG